mgnify:CR=1 FL=1
MATKRLKYLTGTPRQAGWTFPAEWERHSGTWFSWPRPEGISFPDKYHTIPANLAAIVGAIAPRELVHINVPNSNYERIVSEQLVAHGVKQRDLGKRVRFHHIPTNEAWCRDHGPAFLTKQQRGKTLLSIVDWGFNAWGGKYADLAEDTRIFQNKKPRIITKIILGIAAPQKPERLYTRLNGPKVWLII